MKKYVAFIVFLLMAPMVIVYGEEQKKCTDYVTADQCQKIGQMLIVGFGGMHIDKSGKVINDDPNSAEFSDNSNVARDIRDYHVGNVILFSKTYRNFKKEEMVRERNVKGPKQLAKLNRDLKNYSDTIRQKQGLPKIPLFIAIDQEGGMVNRLEYEYGFRRLPLIVPQALGEKERMAGADVIKKQQALDESYRYATRIAKALKKENIDIDFSPVVDVNINPTSPVIGALGRSYSSDPIIVANQATQMINGLHQYGIKAVLKHFPGHGSSKRDSHQGFVDVTDSYQKDKELLPYRKLFDAGFQDMVMTSHVVNGQIDQTQCKKGEKNDRSTWCPGTMSKKTLTTLLRNQLGFKGVLVSDDMTMDAITEEYSLDVALEKSINAGVDMFIIGNHQRNETPKIVLTIAKLVHDGRVKKERIEEAYGRIVRLKKDSF